MEIEIGGATWVILGLLGYIAFSAYLASGNLAYMKRRPLTGVFLLLAALMLGPACFFMFVAFALGMELKRELGSGTPAVRPTEIRNG